MSNIDKRSYRTDGGDIGTGRIREIADNPYGDEEKCWLAKRMLAMLDELEAAERRIAELEDPEWTGEVSNEELSSALKVHRLKVDGHSQLSDAFRAGFKYARRAAAGKGEAS